MGIWYLDQMLKMPEVAMGNSVLPIIFPANPEVKFIEGFFSPRISGSLRTNFSESCIKLIAP